MAQIPNPYKLSGVRLGEYDVNARVDCLPENDLGEFVCADEPVVAAVERAIVHPGFLKLEQNRLHDVALVRLARPVEFSRYVEPICLPSKRSSIKR